MKKDNDDDIDGEEKEKKYESTALKTNGLDDLGKEKKLKMHYKSGPVKKYDRSREKVESDYSTCEYPQSSRLIDLIRCSITVDTVDELLTLLQSIIDVYSSETHEFKKHQHKYRCVLMVVVCLLFSLHYR